MKTKQWREICGSSFVAHTPHFITDSFHKRSAASPDTTEYFNLYIMRHIEMSQTSKSCTGNAIRGHQKRPRGGVAIG